MKRFSLLISIAAGLVAMLAVSLYISGREAALLEQVEMRDVVVATQDILANTVVDERVVQLSQVPLKYLQPAAITAMADAIGRVTEVPIPVGAQLTGVALQAGGAVGLAFEVPRGMRAVTLAVSDVSGVAGLVRPGNFVDLIGTFEYGRPAGVVNGQITYRDETTETLTLAQNVQVVAAGTMYRGKQAAPRPAVLDPEEEEALAGAGAPSDPENIESVTVLVSPRQVQELVLAQQIGDLTLSLRSNLDAGGVVDLERLDPLKLLGVEIPVKPRGRPSWREIRGVER